MCRLLAVSASGYYAWHARPESPRARRDRALMAEIRRVHEASKGVYGSPRVHAELVAGGLRVGRHKVARSDALGAAQGMSQAALSGDDCSVIEGASLQRTC